MKLNQNQRHVADELNKLNRNDYLVTLFLPENVRVAAQSLFAFSAELSVVRQRVSEPTPGEIRLQWWHDALNGEGHGAVRANPIADQLLNAIDQYKLPKVPLLRMVAAHRFDLYDDPMTDVNQFEGYAGETRAAIYQFVAMLICKDDDPSVFADAAGHLGVVATYIERMLSFGRDSSKGQIYLPISVFQSFGVDDKTILAGQNTEAVRQAMLAHHEAAKQHLSKAQSAIKLLPKDSRLAFSESAVCAIQLRYLKRKMDNPFLVGPGRSDWRKMASMFAFAAKN